MPCVFTEVGPAWHNRNLHRLCQKIRSPILFAHVRAAGPGMGVCHCACHPFEYGRYLFMHNGQVAKFGKIRRKLMDSLSPGAFDFCIANSASDSALSFALFVDQLEDPFAPISPQDLQQKLVLVIRTITRALGEAGVVDTSLLNFVVTDGTALAATRFACNKLKECKAASLYYSSGSSFEPSLAGEEPEPEVADSDKGCPKVFVDKVREYRIVHEDKRDNMVIVTSEPLTDVRADWIAVPHNHVILVTPQRHVLIAPVVLEESEGAGALSQSSTAERCAAQEMQQVCVARVGPSRHRLGRVVARPGGAWF